MNIVWPQFFRAVLYRTDGSISNGGGGVLGG